MDTATTVLITVIALLHVYFLIVEMFLWDKPYGLRVFGQSKEKAEASKVLAMNQGLYNGFLAAGLCWGLLSELHGHAVQMFFLCCVLLAGLFGGITANRKILWIQALPAGVALTLLLV